MKPLSGGESMRATNKRVKQFVVTSAVAAGAMLAAPNAGEAALGDQPLKEGMWHEDVKELQDVLKRKGYFTYHTSTGFFGPITKEALINFQRQANIPVTGIADEQTFKALNVSARSSSQNDGSASGQTLSTNQLLRIGSRGNQVSLLQERLQKEGYYTYNIDGIFGRLTEQAVRRYQQANGLKVDGIAGPQTLSHLNGNKAPEAPRNTVSDSKDNSAGGRGGAKAPSSTLLKKGSRGQAVTDLQNKLKRLGFFSANATGYYGDITTQAVRDFQRKYGLAIDGIAGPNTFSKLEAVLKGEDDKVLNDSSFNVMNLIADASEYIGVPYVWGGNTPQQGFDCSGFIVYVFKKQGIQLPRTVAQIWNVGKAVSKPQVGDLVFFETYKPGASHVGIYIGNNKFIQAGTSTGVTISNMTSSYWSSRYVGAKRVH